MDTLERFAENKLAALAARQLRRSLHETAPCGPVEVKRNGRRLILFCSNDYLNLSQHPAVKQAAIEATERWGAGAGASRLVTGKPSSLRGTGTPTRASQGHRRCLRLRLRLPRQPRNHSESCGRRRPDRRRRAEPRVPARGRRALPRQGRESSGTTTSTTWRNCWPNTAPATGARCCSPTVCSAWTATSHRSRRLPGLRRPTTPG